MIKGLLIEDDPENIESYKERFRLREIELIDIATFPTEVDAFWDIVISSDVDFIIIDNHLHKKCVTYCGLEVLEAIRKQDPEIYIIYLTCKGIDTTRTAGFDLEIEKDKLGDELNNIVQRIKRAYTRDLSYKMEREIAGVLDAQTRYYDEQIKLLKEKIN